MTGTIYLVATATYVRTYVCTHPLVVSVVLCVVYLVLGEYPLQCCPGLAPSRSSQRHEGVESRLEEKREEEGGGEGRRKRGENKEGGEGKK